MRDFFRLVVLTVLAAGVPRLALCIELDGADKIGGLDRFNELAIRRQDDDAIVFPVANPQVARLGIHCKPMSRIKLPRAMIISKILVFKIPVLVEMQNSRITQIVGRIA